MDRSLQNVQPLADLPVQSTKKVLQPLAELLPAQAAAELVQPGAPSQAANSIQPLAELQHVLMRRRWTRRTITRIQNTNVQPLKPLRPRLRPLAELQHQRSCLRLQPLAENQTVKVIPTHIGDGVDRVHAQPKIAVTVLAELQHQ